MYQVNDDGCLEKQILQDKLTETEQELEDVCARLSDLEDQFNNLEDKHNRVRFILVYMYIYTLNVFLLIRK